MNRLGTFTAACHALGSSRRWLLVALAALIALPAFGARPAEAQRARPTPWGVCAPGVSIAGYSDALDKATFEGTNIGGLSGLVHDAERGVYYALVDNEDGQPARFYTLSIASPTSQGFPAPVVLDVTVLTDENGEPFTDENFDGEAIAVTRAGNLLIASETEPSIREFSIDGQLLRELRVPDRFLIEPVGAGQPNASLESVTVTPSGRSVYSAMEAALSTDGEDQIRILRHNGFRFNRTANTSEFYYQTEPGQVVGEMVALSETELLVLERSFTPGFGNTIRLFLTSTAGAPDVSNVDSLDGAGFDPLPKRLIVDIVDCPDDGVPVLQPQPNALLDNFEGLALGPVSRGQQIVYLLSDDNFNTGVQITRLIALGIDPDLLDGPVVPAIPLSE